MRYDGLVREDLGAKFTCQVAHLIRSKMGIRMERCQNNDFLAKNTDTFSPFLHLFLDYQNPNLYMKQASEMITITNAGVKYKSDSTSLKRNPCQPQL